jgi:hypothetical protein
VAAAVMAAVGDAGVFDFNPLLSMVVEEVLNQGALAAIILLLTALVMMAFRPTFVKLGERSLFSDPVLPQRRLLQEVYFTVDTLASVYLI